MQCKIEDQDYYFRTPKRTHGQKVDIKKCIIKTIYHKCKLCSKSVTCELSNLRKHFKVVHSINPKEYCKQTGCTLVALGQYRLNKSFLETLQISKNIERTCIFTCKACNKTFSDSFHFKYHMGRHHKKVQFTLEDSLTDGSSYKCEKCSRLMLCDQSLILRHLRRTHSSKGNKLNIPVNIWMRQYKEYCNNFKAKIPISSKVWKKPVVAANKIPIEEATSIIGNLCTFKCPTCVSKYFSSWYEITKHLQTMHNQSRNSSPLFVATARYHFCLICPKAVLSDRRIISNHLKKCHKISLRKYEEKFRKHGGKAFLKYNEWLHLNFGQK